MYKYVLLLLLISCRNDSGSETSRIIVERVDPSKLQNVFPGTEYSASDQYFKIRLKGDSSDLGFLEFVRQALTFDEKLGVIEELLALKGDNRRCALSVLNYNPSSS